jgi:hypothetical protein
MEISAILVALLDALSCRGVSAYIVRNHDRKHRHGNLE